MGITSWNDVSEPTMVKPEWQNLVLLSKQHEILSNFLNASLKTRGMEILKADTELLQLRKLKVQIQNNVFLSTNQSNGINTLLHLDNIMKWCKGYPTRKSARLPINKNIDLGVEYPRSRLGRPFVSSMGRNWPKEINYKLCLT